ncbi:MAG: hypothetical protein WD607_09840 [Candidatus Paceibacterota bacterium]
MIESINIFPTSRPSVLIAGIFLTLIVTACGILNSEESFSLEIKTDKNIYVITEDDSVFVTIKNTSNKTVFYSTCFEKRIEILESDVLIDTIHFPVCECICAAELKPGEEMPLNRSSHNLSNIDQHNQFREGENISYRMKYALFEDKAWGEKPLPKNERRSNQFKLLLPE